MKYRIPFFYDYVFPNFVLPNAMPKELAIINYLHSQHSNRTRHDSLFESVTDHTGQVLINTVFGNDLGTWQTTISGSNIFHSCYNNVIDPQVDSVYYGKRNKENEFNRYIYPIQVTPHFDTFTGVYRYGSKLNGEYFWKHISAEVLDDARNRKAIIFLDYAEENFVEKNTFISLHDGLRRSGIPKEQIILSFNSTNAQEVYESWFTPEERCLEVRNWSYQIDKFAAKYTLTPETRISEQEWQASRSLIRKNYFVFKIRRPHRHRLAILYKMASANLLNKGDWSCLVPLNPQDLNVDSMVRDYPFEYNPNQISDLIAQLPHTLESEPEKHFGNTGGDSDSHCEFYKNAYFDICTETFVRLDYKSLTEKIYKPIGNFQPFVFFAYPGALQVLRDQGFRTFSPFINEDYDNEPNAGTRANMIFAEINRLCSMSKEEIHRWYWQMEDILLHNHKHLLSFYGSENSSVQLIKYLHERVKA